MHVGCLFPIRTSFSMDIYYEHQNLIGKHPNQQLDQLGAILNVHLGAIRSRR